MKPIIEPTNFIRKIGNFDSGGNCPVDLILLSNGYCIGISGESICVYPHISVFSEAILTEDIVSKDFEPWETM